MVPIFTAMACALAAAADAETAISAPVSIELRERWTNVFGGQTAKFHVEVRSHQALVGRLGLALLAPTTQRPLWRHEVPLHTQAGRIEVVPLEVPVPPVKDDVSLPLVFQARVFGDGEAARAECETTWWAFGPDPFAGRNQWLESLELVLFDPAGTTADTFQQAGIPFLRVRNSAALLERRSGLVVVGEGLSFRKNRALAESLSALPAQGVSVLCLAPAEGEIALPGVEDGPAVPAALAFRRQDVIAELDKRLDARAWPADREIIAASLALAGSGSGVVARVGTGEGGWPWMEAVSFVEGELPGRRPARFIVCGFPLIAKWGATPAPRYLLLRLLERLSGDSGQTAAAAVGPQP